MLSARLALLAAIAALALHFFWISASLAEARGVVVVTEKMRRLSSLVIQNFPDRKLESEESFWKVIGVTEPFKDVWGTPYRLEKRYGGSHLDFFWRSAGPDRQWNTRDDIQVNVPYADGPLKDFSQDHESAAPAVAPAN